MRPGIWLDTTVPTHGIRWAYQSEDDTWLLRDPPSDWAMADYQATEPLHISEFIETLDAGLTVPRHQPELAHQFYLAVTSDVVGMSATIEPAPVTEPDLFLSVANARLTPGTIMALASRFGFLNYDTQIVISADRCADIRGLFRDEPLDPVVGDPHARRTCDFFVSCAMDWLRLSGNLRGLVRSWQDIKNKGDPDEIIEFLDWNFRSRRRGTLRFVPVLEHESQKIGSTLIAPTLEDFLYVQLAESIAAGAGHRQCSECSSWFPVHPEKGRPDKTYCSDACRMRAYRARKAAKGKNGS